MLGYVAIVFGVIVGMQIHGVSVIFVLGFWIVLGVAEKVFVIRFVPIPFERIHGRIAVFTNVIWDVIAHVSNLIAVSAYLSSISS